MKVLRYTEEIQKAVGSKTKAEPWLHIAIVPNMSSSKYAIYVWDSRKVIESGGTSMSYERIRGTVAKDNHEPLQGIDNKDFSFANKIVIMDAGQFEDNCEKQWSSLPASIKRGMIAFVHDMDKKYGKNRHKYGHLLDACKKGIDPMTGYPKYRFNH